MRHIYDINRISTDPQGINVVEDRMRRPRNGLRKPSRQEGLAGRSPSASFDIVKGDTLNEIASKVGWRGAQMPHRPAALSTFPDIGFASTDGAPAGCPCGQVSADDPAAVTKDSNRLIRSIENQRIYPL